MKHQNPVKARNHYALFAPNTPFRAKKCASKVKYTRKQKHKLGE